MEQTTVVGERGGHGAGDVPVQADVCVTCPIDHDECEGANGPVGSSVCQSRCQAGLTWMTEVLKYKRNPPVKGTRPAPVPAQHGGRSFAIKLKCQCEPCLKYKAKYRADAAKRKRETYKPKKRPKWRHGTRYGWETKKCKCIKCLDHKIPYMNRKNQLATERKRKARAEAAGRTD